MPDKWNGRYRGCSNLLGKDTSTEIITLTITDTDDGTVNNNDCADR